MAERLTTGHQARSTASVGDVAIAAVLTLVAQVDVWAPRLAVWGDDPVPGSAPVNAALFLVATGAVAWRRSAPLPALTVSMVAIAVQAAASGDAPIGLLVLAPVLLLTWAVAAHAARIHALLGLGVVAITTAVHEAFDAEIRTASDVGEASYWWLVILLTWLAGRYTASRRQARDEADRSRRREEELAQAEAEAVAVERLRIAQELHDVVAHDVSVMALQAGAALELLDRSPERAREPLVVIERTARDALEEMGTLVGVLRLRGGSEPESAPPRLIALDDLARRVGVSGISVDVRRLGTPRRLPPGVELSAYRIVQEALTNTLKHARSATRADVVIDYRADELRVSVRDDGTGTHEEPARGGGHGLPGMRERAAAYGGEVLAGPSAAGGFVVEARLHLRGVGT